MPKSATFRSCVPITTLLILASVSSSLISPMRARADLEITGASTSQRDTLQSIFNNHIPARFRTKDEIDVQVFDRQAMLDYIHEGEPADQSADQAGDDTIDGIYEDGPPTVTLRSTPNLDDLSFTFSHEYGHYVWQDLLTKAQHKEYAAIYYKERAAHHLVTAYAATELDEGFAEAFSFYAMAPPILQKRDPLSYRFLCSLQPGREAPAGPTDPSGQ